MGVELINQNIGNALEPSIVNGGMGFCCYYHKLLTLRFNHTVLCPKDADGKANRVDSDQTDLDIPWFSRQLSKDNYGNHKFL